MLIPIIPYLIIGTIEGFRIIGNRWIKVTDANSFSTRAKTLILITVVGLALSNIVETWQSIDENYPVLKANLGGNELAGFTEDWANYLRASLWIRKNLPIETTGIVCRKPELFLLYAGNYNVYGTYKIDQTNPDSIVAKWKSLKMTHIIYDNFQWTSTLRRYVQPIAEKYPQMFEMIHQEGSQYPMLYLSTQLCCITDSISFYSERRTDENRTHRSCISNPRR